MEYMKRKETVDDQWPYGPDTMDWAISTAPDGEEITEVMKKDDTDKRKYDIKTRHSYDNNNDNNSNKYVHKTGRKDIKVIENRQLVPPRMERKGTVDKDGTNFETDMANEWKMVSNKGNRRLVVRNRAISKFNQYSDTPDSGSSVLHNKLDTKERSKDWGYQTLRPTATGTGGAPVDATAEPRPSTSTARDP